MVKRNADYFVSKIPEKYRDRVTVIGSDLGGRTCVKYKNLCGHISECTVKALSDRKQFETCKKCTLSNRNESLNIDYLSRVDESYRNMIVDTGIGHGYHNLVVFKHPGCGCSVQYEIGHLVKKKSLNKCKSCISKSTCLDRAFTYQDFLNKIPLKYRKQIFLVGEFNGRLSVVDYKFLCGHSDRLTLNALIQRKNFETCSICAHPVCLSKEEIINTLDLIKNPVIVSGFPGNKTTIIRGSCMSCGKDIQDTFFNLQQYYARNKFECCKWCNTNSNKQIQLFDFVKSLCSNVVVNDISTIKFDPDDTHYKELDILCVDNNFAIEFNGLYYHSDKFKYDKLYHNKKTLASRKMGISLFHIWEDKWDNRKDIIKSMIKHRLGMTENRVYARKTSIKELSKMEAKEFFDNNHLDGNVGNITSFGLVYDGKLVQAISVRKPNSQSRKHSGYVEIARLATLVDTIVVGGEAKLLSAVERWARERSYTGILTYVDSDLGSFPGKRWKFDYRGETGVSYFYTKHNYPQRISRQKVQARDGKSERQIADELGLLRVNTNTNMIYVYDF
jgi:hypothetical protein